MRRTKDPGIRTDGKCYQCGGPRLVRLPKVQTKRDRKELLQQLAADPFCAATCARAYFGVDLVEQPAKGAAHTDLHEWAIGA